jgi:hypothetical protein
METAGVRRDAYAEYFDVVTALAQQGNLQAASEKRAAAQLREAREGSEIDRTALSDVCREHQESTERVTKQIHEMLRIVRLGRLMRPDQAAPGRGITLRSTDAGHLQVLTKEYDISKDRIGCLINKCIAVAERQERVTRLIPIFIILVIMGFIFIWPELTYLYFIIFAMITLFVFLQIKRPL